MEQAVHKDTAVSYIVNLITQDITPTYLLVLNISYLCWHPHLEEAMVSAVGDWHSVSSGCAGQSCSGSLCCNSHTFSYYLLIYGLLIT